MLDQKSLKDTAKLNDAATALFEKYSDRERFRRNVNLKRLRRELSHEFGSDIDAKELLATFEKLQELGVGSIVYGRNGKDTQFFWHYSLKDIAQAIKGKLSVSELQPLKPMPGHKPPIMPLHKLNTPNVTAVASAKPGPGELQIFVLNQNNKLLRFKIPPGNNATIMTILNSLGESV